MPLDQQRLVTSHRLSRIDSRRQLATAGVIGADCKCLPTFGAARRASFRAGNGLSTNASANAFGAFPCFLVRDVTGLFGGRGVSPMQGS